MEKDKKNIEDLLGISPACGNCNNSRKEYLIHFYLPLMIDLNTLSEMYKLGDEKKSLGC